MKTILFFLAICFSTCTFASEKSTHFYDENSGISVVIPAGLKKSWNVNNEQNGVNITMFNTSDDSEAVSVAVIGQVPLSMLGDCSEEDCMTLIMNQMNMIPMGQINPESIMQMEGDCGCTAPVEEEKEPVSCKAQACDCNISCDCKVEETMCGNTCQECIEEVANTPCIECECDAVSLIDEECDFPEFNSHLERLEDVNFDNLTAKHFQFSMEMGKESFTSNVYIFLDDQYFYVVTTVVCPAAEDEDLDQMSNDILKSIRFFN